MAASHNVRRQVLPWNQDANWDVGLIKVMEFTNMTATTKTTYKKNRGMVIHDTINKGGLSSKLFLITIQQANPANPDTHGRKVRWRNMSNNHRPWRVLRGDFQQTRKEIKNARRRLRQGLKTSRSGFKFGGTRISVRLRLPTKPLRLTLR